MRASNAQEVPRSRPLTLTTSTRVRLLAGTVVLHLAVYYSVNALNSLRPSSHYWSFHTQADAWIPYLGWTSVIYYLGSLYVVIAGAAVVWRLNTTFVRAITAYIGLILTGGVIQVLIPAPAPFPSELSSVQQLLHGLLSVRPYATLPSMHVALTVLPTGIALSVLKSRPPRILASVAALLITVSTLTAKEHFFLDAVTGAALGAAFYGWWCLGSLRSGR